MKFLLILLLLTSCATLLHEKKDAIYIAKSPEEFGSNCNFIKKVRLKFKWHDVKRNYAAAISLLEKKAYEKKGNAILPLFKSKNDFKKPFYGKIYYCEMEI
jgi:hypothetical protein